LTVLTGTSDILNVDARRLAERCRAVTQPCEVLEEPRMTHVWMFLPFVPEARAARAAIVARCRGARRP
jgi:acetyl esterase/lipase